MKLVIDKYLNEKNGIYTLIFISGLIIGGTLILGNDKLCLFHNITGFPCPGCGMTRAFLRFFSGDIKGALYYHPLFWSIPFLFSVVFLSKYSLFLQKLKQNDLFWVVITIIFLLVYFIRLYYMFPDHEPMDFNRNAVFIRIFSVILK